MQIRPYSIRRVFTVIMAFAGGVFVFPSAGLRAALIEVPIHEYTNDAFADYALSGIVRTDVNGNIYSFSSANFPNSPATVVNLTPAIPGKKTLVKSFQHVVFNQSRCIKIFGNNICGGVRAVSTVNFYHFENPYNFSIEGLVNLDDMTATAAPVPTTSDLHFQVTVGAAKVQFTGLLNSLPGFLKTPLINAAQVAVNQFGSGTVDMTSTITQFDPVTVTVATDDSVPGFKKITLDWTDILMLYSPPEFEFTGTLTHKILSVILGETVDANSALIINTEFVNDQIEQSLRDHSGTGSTNFECPFPNPDHCVFVEAERFSFFVPFGNEQGTPPAPIPNPGTGRSIAGVPEPHTLLLLGAGLAFSFARRKE